MKHLLHRISFIESKQLSCKTQWIALPCEFYSRPEIRLIHTFRYFILGFIPIEILIVDVINQSPIFFIKVSTTII